MRTWAGGERHFLPLCLSGGSGSGFLPLDTALIVNQDEVPNPVLLSITAI